MSWRRLAATAAVLATAGLAAAPAAEASFHLIKVREVFPGTIAHPDSSYVELQMYAAGQNLVQLGNLKVYDSAGALQSTIIPSNAVASGAIQSTVLIADTDYAGQFPGGPAPDFSSSDLALRGAGGAVCWPQTEPPFDDCASWGNFTGQAMLPSKDTAPAASAGIPDGMAIRRSIAPGCSTLLESGDDTDNSSVDFSLATPAPRDNASPIAETTACTTGTPPHGPPAPPQTFLGKAPPKRSHDHTPSFRFRSSQSSSTFQCRIDRKPFRACRSPYTAKALSPGRHRFSVRAKNGAGQTDVTPAGFSFTVLR